MLSPGASTPAARRVMQGNRSRDTQPEMAVRRAAHALGLRYRVDAPLPGMPRRRADMLFPGRRVAVFVDGCYWHGCPAHGTVARTNAGYWAAKIGRNRDRDLDTDDRLRSAGWTPVRIWEHDDPAEAAKALDVLLGGLDGAASRRPDRAAGAPG